MNSNDPEISLYILLHRNQEYIRQAARDGQADAIAPRGALRSALDTVGRSSTDMLRRAAQMLRLHDGPDRREPAGV